MIHQRHRQTDRRTDDMQSQDRTLHYSASRGKQCTVLLTSDVQSSRYCAWPCAGVRNDNRLLLPEGESPVSASKNRTTLLKEKAQHKSGLDIIDVPRNFGLGWGSRSLHPPSSTSMSVATSLLDICIYLTVTFSSAVIRTTDNILWYKTSAVEVSKIFGGVGRVTSPVS